MTNENLLSICHSCPLRQRPCAGACLCVDGVDIAVHVETAQCPHGFDLAKIHAAEKPKKEVPKNLTQTRQEVLSMRLRGTSPRKSGGCGCGRKK